MADEKHTVRNGIIIVVGGAIALALLSVLWSWFVAFLTWVGSIILPIWAFNLRLVLLPTWLLGLLLIPTIYVVSKIVAALFRTKTNSAAQPREPVVSDYNEDSFFGMTWRWQLWNNRIDDLTAFCPDDDTMLVRGRHGRTYACETCHEEFGTFREPLEAQGAVERQIDRKVRLGEWRKVVLQKIKPGASQDV